MRDTPHALMLFAAGFGTRMGALTADRPKPLVPVAGRAMIDHALHWAHDAALSPIVVNTHYKADMIATHLAGRNVTVSPEFPDILETGGGLRHALALLGEAPVMTLNSDAIWLGPNPLGLLSAAWNPDQMDALLLCLPPENTTGRDAPGDFVADAAGRLTRGPGLIYGGAQVIRTQGLYDITETVFSLNLLWDRMINDGRLFGLTYPGKWCDIGTPDGLALAEQMLAANDV